MANRFLADSRGWRSIREPRASGSNWPPELVLYTSEIGSDVQINVRHDRDPEVVADNTNPSSSTTNPVPPRIRFTRSVYDNGAVVGTITYLGWMTSEREIARGKSKIHGTYEITPTGVSPRLDPESGDWTANRPPPGPGPRGGAKKASGNKTTTGKTVAAAKKSSARKATKPQKPSAKNSSAVQKSARFAKTRKRTK